MTYTLSSGTLNPTQLNCFHPVLTALLCLKADSRCRHQSAALVLQVCYSVMSDVIQYHRFKSARNFCHISLM